MATTRSLEHETGLSAAGVQTNVTVKTFLKPYLISGLSIEGYVNNNGFGSEATNLVITIVRDGDQIGTLLSPGGLPGTLYAPEDHVWLFKTFHVSSLVETYNFEGSNDGSFMVQTGDSLVFSIRSDGEIKWGCSISWDMN